MSKEAQSAQARWCYEEGWLTGWAYCLTAILRHACKALEQLCATPVVIVYAALSFILLVLILQPLLSMLHNYELFILGHYSKTITDK
jgi:hypothetical protein